MSKVIGGYDPRDWLEYVKRGAVLHCDGGASQHNMLLPAVCFESVEVVRSGELPAGWVMLRENLAEVEGYCLTVYCPRCDPVYGVQSS
jgi:hypothetical protein